VTIADSSAFDLVVRGDVVTPGGIIANGWVGVRDGVIAAIGDGAPPSARDIHDHSDKFLMPGAIDGQVHACSWRGLDGIASTTRSALAGGVTTIVDMPYDDPNPLTSVPLLELKQAAIARQAHCDVALYGTISGSQDPADIIALAEAGICAIKISSFENHPARFPRIRSNQMLDLFEVARTIGIPVGLHNEDQDIVEARTARLKAEGIDGILAHSPSRPVAAEMSATAHFLELAASVDAHAHIVHLSAPRGFDLVETYAEQGFQATSEMCVHYLLLDDERDGERLGALMKVNPPIRSGVTDALWERLEAGIIAFVSSDHSGWPIERKQAASIFGVSAGVPGLETLVPGFMTGCAERGLDAAALTARYIAENPAKFFGLWPRKGGIMVGADADITVMARETYWFDASKTHDELNWSPFDGDEFSFRVTSTYLRGVLGYDGTAILAEPGSGRFCPGGPIAPQTLAR